MESLSIKYENVDLVVKFEYEPEEPASYYDPGIPALIEIDKILVQGVDIAHIMASEDYREVVKMLWQKLEQALAERLEA